MKIISGFIFDLALVISCFAQGNAILHGAVVDQNKKPISATLTLTRLNEKEVRYSTDANNTDGKYSFTAVQPGTYMMMVTTTTSSKGGVGTELGLLELQAGENRVENVQVDTRLGVSAEVTVSA